MSEQQTVALLNRLQMPEGKVFTKEEVTFILEARSSKTYEKLRTNSAQQESELTKRSEKCPGSKHSRTLLLPHIH
jgi:hypothetical protein